ncbi:Hypothetical protein PBC10988_21500 [Planctomycetales bacterium 10988]|nr:Hypothetical protein PBC10988_21500 [Planctomycetales bacterium 10988]
MGKRASTALSAAALLYGSLFLIEFASQAQAQVIPLPSTQRPTVILPDARGATAASTIIHAKAALAVGLGQLAESLAIARRHHAAAVEHEMQNRRQWVDTYFEMRAANRAYRREEDPPFLERAAKRHAQRERVIYDQTYLIQGKEISADDLNFLLRELAIAPSLASTLLNGGLDVGQESLSQDELKHIRLTDGAMSEGSRMVFRAHDGQVLRTDWPFLLRSPEFEQARLHFEELRDASLAKLKAGGSLTPEEEANLMLAVDDLATQLELEYPRERRTNDYLTFSRYKGAKLFLQELALGIYRLLETNDQEAISGGLAFEGDSIGGLVLHLLQQSLEFAPPEAGDERVYKKLFLALREMAQAVDGRG